MSFSDVELIKPFGPRIGHFKLKNNIVEKFIKLTDDIIEDNNSESNANRLAGQLETELSIPTKKLIEADLYDLFSDIMRKYVIQTITSISGTDDRAVNVFMTEMWVNSQFKNEYNPAHYHPSCTLSSVFYLKVPDFKKRKVHNESKKENTDGRIFFANNACGESDKYLEKGTTTIQPSVGDLFIWPSRLIHGVYPFSSAGERRSVAFNGVHNFY